MIIYKIRDPIVLSPSFCLLCICHVRVRQDPLIDFALSNLLATDLTREVAHTLHHLSIIYFYSKPIPTMAAPGETLEAENPSTDQTKKAWHEANCHCTRIRFRVLLPPLTNTPKPYEVCNCD